MLNVYQVILRIVTMSKRAPQLNIKGRVKKQPKLTIVPFPKTQMGRRLGSTNQMALRTGGWANPSKGGELKFKDVTVDGNVAHTTAAFNTGILLNGLTPGSSASERIGRKVTIKSLLIRWSVHLSATTTGGAPIRILVVYDRQANAAAPAITDILLTDNFNANNNLSNRDRFITIFDQYSEPISVQNNYATNGVLYKSLNLEETFNSGNAGNIGDISTGSIYIFVAAAESIGVANLAFEGRSRVRYTDV